MYYIGTFILAWLLVGFLTGVRQVYVNQILDDVNFVNKLRENPKPGTQNLINHMATRKSTMLVIFTVMGFYALWMELKLLPMRIKYLRRRRHINKLLRIQKYLNKHNGEDQKKKM